MRCIHLIEGLCVPFDMYDPVCLPGCEHYLPSLGDREPVPAASEATMERVLLDYPDAAESER